jgi:hypothetical protein
VCTVALTLNRVAEGSRYSLVVKYRLVVSIGVFGESGAVRVRRFCTCDIHLRVHGYSDVEKPHMHADAPLKVSQAVCAR